MLQDHRDGAFTGIRKIRLVVLMTSLGQQLESREVPLRHTSTGSPPIRAVLEWQLEAGHTEFVSLPISR